MYRAKYPDRYFKIREKRGAAYDFLTEYDEKKHLRHTFAEGREEKLIEMIQKKHAKGKSPEVIAEELEEDLDIVRDILTRL